MAPRKMPSRRMPASRKQSRAIKKVLEEGVFTTTDPQGQINVFRQYQDAGFLPSGYDTPKQLTDALSEKIAEGKTKKEALAALNVELGASFFDKKGNFNQRVFRNAQSPALVEAWNQRTQGLTAQQLSKLEGSEWSDLQKYYQEVGRRLGMKLDIGHFQTSASGAPGNVAAAGGEYAKANQAAGRSAANPPRPQTRYEELNTGMATNKIEGLSEAANLASDLPTRGGLRGAPLNPYIAVLLGTNLKGQSSRFLPESNLEALNFEFDRLEKKEGLNPVAMYDYILERAGENINIDDMARAGLEDYDISKFAPDVPNAKAGPLRTVRPADKVGTTEGVPKGLIPKGIMRGAAAVAGAVPGIGALLDTGDVIAGTQQVMGSQSRQQQTLGGLRAASGALGLASLGAPVLAPAAMAVGGVSALAERRAAMPGTAQVDQLIPTPKPVMANTPTGVAQLTAAKPSAIPQAQSRPRTATAARTQGQMMPKTQPLNLANEGQYFIVNPIRSAFSSIFGKREI